MAILIGMKTKSIDPDNLPDGSGYFVDFNPEGVPKVTITIDGGPSHYKALYPGILQHAQMLFGIFVDEEKTWGRKVSWNLEQMIEDDDYVAELAKNNNKKFLAASFVGTQKELFAAQSQIQELKTEIDSRRKIEELEDEIRALKDA